MEQSSESQREKQAASSIEGDFGLPSTSNYLANMFILKHYQLCHGAQFGNYWDG